MMNSTTSRFLATDPDEYEHFMGRWSRRLSSPLLEFAGTKRGDRVLDVGCGTGILTSALADRGSKAVGIDASEAYITEARRHRSHAEVTYELGDVRQLSYADSSFDVCVSTLVLDIIPEFAQVVREMRRVTRPGGVVASGVFAGISLRRRGRHIARNIQPLAVLVDRRLLQTGVERDRDRSHRRRHCDLVGAHAFEPHYWWCLASRQWYPDVQTCSGPWSR
jgi:2-polyprenyl-3-methyl-5-hydroxy-6-metoxy-1,4-benzoquinol methylase